MNALMKLIEVYYMMGGGGEKFSTQPVSQNPVKWSIFFFFFNKLETFVIKKTHTCCFM